MRITTLSENTAGKDPKGLLAEYGLSILVDTDSTKILFDSGQKKSAVHNATILGIDLSAIEKIVLSHGHFDHAGGLKSVLEKTGVIEIIAHPDIFLKKYAKFGKKNTYIGIPNSRKDLENSGARFKLTKESTKIGDITVTGEVEQNNTFEKIDKNMYVDNAGDFIKDDLLDDQSLSIKTDEGLFVILGCAHRGMINNIEQAKKITGEDRIYGVIGGTHLIAADKVQMDETVKALKEYEVQKIGVSHCTGPKASSRLADEFGEKFFYNNAGSVIDF